MKKMISLLLVCIMLVSVSMTAIADTTQTLSLDKASVALKVGECSTLVASLNTVPTQAVTWRSSDTSVAMVNDGIITGVKLGIATVTATTASGLTASCIVHIVLKGIDVSSWQYNISWNNVKADGIDFAMIREGYGSENWSSQTDKYFEANYAGATQAGLKVGVYHYSYATTVAQAVLEAQMCLHNLNGRKLDYPVTFDVEDKCQAGLSSELLTNMVVAFCSTIEQGGYKTALYTNPSWYYAKFTSSKLNQLDIWIANWEVNTPNVSRTFTMWQYSDCGTVAGVTNGVVDLDYSYRDYSSTDPISQISVTHSTPEPTPISTVVTKPTGSITIDTKSYNMSPRNIYDVGVKLVGAAGKPIKIYSSRSGVATVKKLANGNYRITGVSAGVTYILVEVYSGGGTLLTHASVKVTVAKGVRQYGNDTHVTSYFYV